MPSILATTITSEEAKALFMKCNCALVSASRTAHSTEGEKRNEANSQELAGKLTRMGLHFIVVDGCYREKFEDEPSHEVSFLVYDTKANGLKFFTQIYQLSEHYGQDSFLYKSAGITWRAFLVMTNDDARQEGNVKLAGKLKLNLPPVGPYTNLGQGRVTFKISHEEELTDTQVATQQPSAPESRQLRGIIRKRRFMGRQVLAATIVLAKDGKVTISGYVIGQWSRTAPGHYEATISKKNAEPVRAPKLTELRQAIAKACKRGITGQKLT